MYTHNNFNSIVSGLGNRRMSIYHDTTDVLMLASNQPLRVGRQ
jgi:hypothetical protein